MLIALSLLIIALLLFIRLDLKTIRRLSEKQAVDSVANFYLDLPLTFTEEVKSQLGLKVPHMCWHFRRTLKVSPLAGAVYYEAGAGWICKPDFWSQNIHTQEWEGKSKDEDYADSKIASLEQLKDTLIHFLARGWRFSTLLEDNTRILELVSLHDPKNLYERKSSLALQYPKLDLHS